MRHLESQRRSHTRSYNYNLFGESITEYFLSSSYLPRTAPGWYIEITDNMRGSSCNTD
ncbi:Uncharacterized protein DAT39_006749 [Clarias magur]|uniref:Uncharacterized protein n=1 Tax=Clarias magur TaxID=1594786 RepID=A0A8J4X6G1_CLAMG|nr:Uncharacterized protein DAT39_006749 [Clarias magur]